jgi:haloalkane dehalogenase
MSHRSSSSAPFETPHRFLDVGASRLAYFRVGRGPDVVFVHGWPLHSATFRHIVPRLAEHFTCHLLDLPGAGKTESAEDAPRDFVSCAVALERALDQLQLSRYAFVAHDSGGFIARLIASRDPRVAALVLGNTEVPGHVPTAIRLHARLARTSLGPKLVRWMLRSPFVRASPLGFGGCFADRRHIEGEFRELFVEPLIQSAEYARRQFAFLENMHTEDLGMLEAVHAGIRAPVLLVWGDRDRFFPIERARQMMKQFGGPVELRVIEGAKVFAHDERPEEFAAMADAFLSERVRGQAFAPGVETAA